jgi:hypothetical protein
VPAQHQARADHRDSGGCDGDQNGLGVGRELLAATASVTAVSIVVVSMIFSLSEGWGLITSRVIFANFVRKSHPGKNSRTKT